MVLKPNNSADRSTSVCSGVRGAQMCEDVHLYVCVDGCAPMCAGMGGCVWVFTDVRCEWICIGMRGRGCAWVCSDVRGCSSICVGVHRCALVCTLIRILYKFFLEHFKHTVHFISSWLVFLPWEVL